MKKNLVMIAAALLLGTMSFAQAAGPKGGAPIQFKNGNRGAEGPRGGMMGSKKILDSLNLSASQKAQIEKLNKAQAEKVKAMRDKAAATGNKPDREAFRAQAMKMREGYLAQLKKILTPAQYQKFDAAMKAQRAEFEKRRAQGGMPGAPGAPGARKAGSGKNGGF